MKTLILSAVAAATSMLAIGAMAQASPPAALVDPTTLVNQFETNGGKFAGYRRSGAPGRPGNQGS